MILNMLLFVLAIENLTDMMVNLEFLEKHRLWFESSFPTIGKLARCKYCQSFWLSAAAAWMLPTECFLATWLAVHLLVQLARVVHEASLEFSDRYLNRAPIRVEVLDLPAKGDQVSGS
jgi:hypothetical protein